MSTPQRTAHEDSPSQRRSALGARGLEGHFVSSEDWFHHEVQTIFNQHWLCVGIVDEVPREGWLGRHVLGHSFAVSRSPDDEIACFRNVCRHRGAQLLEDETSLTASSELSCPYHAWRYGRDGSLLAAPNMHGVSEFCKEAHGLLPVPSQVWNRLIWVAVTDQSPEFEPWGTGLDEAIQPWQIHSLRLFQSLDYDVRANWKLIFQNYNECYHCPTVHPALNRLTPYKNATNDFTEGPVLGGPMLLSDPYESMTTDGHLAGQLLPGLSSQQQRVVAYYTVFPNLFVSLHPDYVLFHRLLPIAHDRTRILCDFLFASPDDDGLARDEKEAQGNSGSRGSDDLMATEDFRGGQTDVAWADRAAKAVAFWDETNRQDWEVCERVQQGMQDPGYLPGPYSNLESIVAAFDRHYRSFLGAK